MKIQEIMLTEEWIVAQPINEMAGLPTENTGLPVFLWIGKIGGQHGPRIKVSNIKGKFAEDDCFVVSVGTPPEVLTPKFMRLKKDDLELVLDWVALNHAELMALYKMYETGNGNVIDLLTALKKI
jgi:hypothetical protein